MINLWLAISGLFFLAFIFVAWPLWRHKKTAHLTAIDDSEVNQRLAENVRIFREHLVELENNLASQAIDEKQFAQLKLELERNLLDDEVSMRARNTRSSHKLGVKAVAAFCVLLLVGGIVFSRNAAMPMMFLSIHYKTKKTRKIMRTWCKASIQTQRVRAI